jgi:hypothetical protein
LRIAACSEFCLIHGCSSSGFQLPAVVPLFIGPHRASSPGREFTPAGLELHPPTKAAVCTHGGALALARFVFYSVLRKNQKKYPKAHAHAWDVGGNGEKEPGHPPCLAPDGELQRNSAGAYCLARLLAPTPIPKST